MCVVKDVVHIFISYSTKDDDLSNKWITNFKILLEKEICASVPNVKCDIFFAPESIHTGEEWHNKFLSKINNELDILIAFLSPQYLTSEYCVEELNAGFNLLHSVWKGRIFPIYFNGRGKLEDVLKEHDRYQLEDDLIKYNYLDWRPLRFTSVTDSEARKEIYLLVQDMTSDTLADYPNSSINEKKRDSNVGLCKITKANNDEIFLRQEKRYDKAFETILANCISKIDKQKQLIILELDYRKVEGIRRHIEIYQKLDKELGEIFVLCKEPSACEQIQRANIPNVTPFCLPNGEFEIEPLIKYWEDNGFPKIDIIYSDRNYRYFRDPEYAFLQIRRKLLSAHGGMAIKGFDDGSKLCYPDPSNIMLSIIERTSNKNNVSDRYNGRKMYYRFKLAGFDNIYSEYVLNDTISMDVYQRNDLFEESFDFRKSYFEDDLVEKERIVNDMVKLRNMFYEDSFYYCELNFYVAAAK